MVKILNASMMTYPFASLSSFPKRIISTTAPTVENADDTFEFFYTRVGLFLPPHLTCSLFGKRKKMVLYFVKKNINKIMLNIIVRKPCGYLC